MKGFIQLENTSGHKFGIPCASFTFSLLMYFQRFTGAFCSVRLREVLGMGLRHSLHRQSKCMSVCFSQDPIYFLPATVAAVLQRCCLRSWCNYLWPLCMLKAFDCNTFYRTTKIIFTDQKVRRAITEMVRLPY